MAEIDLLQKTQKKQAEFDAEERTKKATRREEELRQKLRQKLTQGSTLDFRSEMTKALTKAFQSECESPFDLWKASGAQEQKTRCVLEELSSEKEKCIEISVLENVLKMVNHWWSTRSVRKTIDPTDRPSDRPTIRPTDHPTDRTSDRPSIRPTDHPTDRLKNHRESSFFHRWLFSVWNRF